MEAWPLPSTLSSCFSTGCTPRPQQVRKHQHSPPFRMRGRAACASLPNQGAALQQNARKCLFSCCFLSPLPALTCPQSLGSHHAGFAFFSAGEAREKVGMVSGSRRNDKARWGESWDSTAAARAAARPCGHRRRFLRCSLAELQGPRGSGSRRHLSGAGGEPRRHGSARLSPLQRAAWLCEHPR